jgi:TPR repeat protein
MKRTLLFVLALSVIPVGVDAQVTPSAFCADLSFESGESPWLDSPLEDLRTCAEQGNAVAQFSLGVLYADNRMGVPGDAWEAVRWYRLAAEQGLATAMTHLGLMYKDGEGVPEDDAEAMRWYRLGAEHGDGLALTALGYMYSEGDGVPVDDVLAYMWYNLAAAHQGFAETLARSLGAGRKDMIDPRMTREQIDEAQRMSTEWFEAHPPGDN